MPATDCGVASEGCVRTSASDCDAPLRGLLTCIVVEAAPDHGEGAKRDVLLTARNCRDNRPRRVLYPSNHGGVRGSCLVLCPGADQGRSPARYICQASSNDGKVCQRPVVHASAHSASGCRRGVLLPAEHHRVLASCQVSKPSGHNRRTAHCTVAEPSGDNRVLACSIVCRAPGDPREGPPSSVVAATANSSRLCRGTVIPSS
mmetsp:Transcript_36727/g.87273  ORF Transcript_36727/g.87273 Transcript_36727/m.87273 type:complete len:203 (-) Transcript_36727:765-1373(-)